MCTTVAYNTRTVSALVNHRVPCIRQLAIFATICIAQSYECKSGWVQSKLEQSLVALALDGVRAVLHSVSVN